MRVEAVRFLLVLLWWVKYGELVALDNAVRWCYVDGYRQYNTSESACFNCSGKYYVTARTKVQSLKCCSNRTLQGKCHEDEISCGDGGFYRIPEKCDGIKNCVNFADETNCTKECDYTTFSCENSRMNSNLTSQCINSSQVCDNTKDCISGLDESNCTYYGSRCDGFLCTAVEQCIGIKKVCDGRKDCLDGTDETMCPGFEDSHSFECKNKEGRVNAYALSEICDGTTQCGDGQDEKNCFDWSEWSAWSKCRCGSQSNQTKLVSRARSCSTLRAGTTSTGKCEGEESQRKSCDCAAMPLSKTQIISYCVMGAILCVVIIGGLIFCRMSRRHRKAWISYTKAVSFFRNQRSETLIDPVRVELSEENHLETFSERILPSSPPFKDNDRPVLQFHLVSTHDYESQDEDSVLAPMEEDRTNPLANLPSPHYRSYQGVPREEDIYNRLSARSVESLLSPARSATGNQLSSDEEDFGSADLVAQIQIARMGNLIGDSDLKIN